MKHRFLFLIFFSLVLHIFSTAQQNRFVYIQTENQQPFFIKINNIIFSSSSSGYLIIPKIKDGVLQLVIGFPKNEWPQQTFSISVNKKDLGFVLKNMGEKGWGLSNLQTMEIIQAKSIVRQINSTVNDDDDPFTQLLSDVVNTPELKQRTVLIEEPVSEITKQAKTEESVVKVETETVVLKLLLNSLNVTGREMVYIDGIDTIKIFIPVHEKLKSVASNITPDNKKVEKEKSIDAVVADPKLKIDSAKVFSTAAEVNDPPATTRGSSITMINSDCTANATEEDLIKLRKKMASEDNIDEMVSVAKKAFRLKCYSTEQVKNLSDFFLRDAGKYQFFDAAYPFVFDTGKFSSLQQQLTDPYYINRFQAMIRQ